MGRNKSKYNWKARQTVQTTTDDSFSNKIKIDIPENKQSYDESNVFVLPTEKRKTVVKRVQLQTKRLLSKKKRKELEAVLKRKKEKEKRSVLLEALSKVQASPEIISRLTSISEVQTKGLKRFLEDEKEFTGNLEVSKKVKNNSLKGVGKMNSETNVVDKYTASNPNIVGFESSSSSEEEEEENNSKNNSPIEIDSDKNFADKEKEILRDDSSSNNIHVSNGENDEFIGERELTLQYLKENKDNDNSVCEEEDISSILFNDGVPVKSVICENRQDENSKTTSIQNKNDNKEKCSSGRVNCNVQQRMRNPEEIDITFDEEDNPTNKTEDSVLSNSNNSVSKTNYVPVIRKPEIQQTRSKLPIIGEEQVIMEAIKENQVVIISGETGSGKTTQVPQFLYEAGYANDGKMIGVTEPRRVAAISMSERVAEELNLSSDEVSYLIRFEGNSGPNTKIKFMTDGVLLKEIQKDFLLSRYSVIILDEVHERSIYTDILIGLLSRIIPLRCKKSMPMRLIIMSATLHIDEFRNNEALFKIPPPVISIESRQFPVTIHFNKTTPQNYMLAAFKKICKIHSSLPDGGILVFVTGQQEVNLLVKKLRQIFSFNDLHSLNNSLKFKNHINYRYVVDELKNADAKKTDEREIHPSDDTDCDLLDDNDDESKIDGEDIDELEFTNIEQILQLANSGKVGKMWVLPLYSLLPGQEQAKVFKPPPPNHRLCVVATNIAETSLTIPNIKYVVDTGRTKVKLYDKFTGVSTYEIVWASKASANQRAGRAGRTAPGHCYRLYSSAVFNDIFEEWSVPEIKRKPIDELVLQMKCLGIDYIKNFPFPSSPGTDQLKAAECRLVLLGALKPHDSLKDRWFTKLTKLGESMSEFAVAPRFGKMLCYSHQHNLLTFTVSIVAALAVPQVLDAVKQSRIRKQHSLTGNRLLLGDIYVLHNACSFIEKCVYEKKESIEKFCDKLGIRYKAVKEVSKLRIQLIKTINVHIQSIQIPITPYISPPNELQACQLRQIVLMGMVDRVARRLDEEESKAADISINKAAYKLSDIDEVAYIHNSSVLYDSKRTWIVYQDAFEQNGRLYMRGITAIEPEWLPLLAPHLCYIPKSYNDQNTFYDPKSQKVVYVVTCTFGRAGWSLPAVPIPCPASEETCRYFAKFLLEGKVCTALKRYADKLLSPPETVLKSWSSLLLPRTQMFLKALLSKGVYGGHKLLAQWEVEPKFLLDPYLEWLPNSYHDEVQKIWPPLS